MGVQLELEWPRYKLFPYEKRLALLEIKTLLGTHEAAPDGVRSRLTIDLPQQPNGEVDKLTYFSSATIAGRKHIPLQARLEGSANGASRQSTRYSAHGLHEYRGKFNPQIVRAIGNIIGLQFGDSVLDPFVGSGTTLLECAHAGWNAVGMDLNPLAVFLANAKLGAVKLDVDVLRTELLGVIRRLACLAERIRYEKAFSRSELSLIRRGPLATLPNISYLESWFPPAVLLQLARIEGEIQRNVAANVRDVFRVVLSDILRDVSWQDPSDLRIRRRKSPAANYPALPLFLDALRKRIGNILAARAVLTLPTGSHAAVLADARTAVAFPHSNARGRVSHYDALITSPPYATALPYIDTQRLSLALLGLVDASALGGTERSLIGSREITGRERNADEAALLSDLLPHSLPVDVLTLCRRVHRLSRGNDCGFRRQNMPALLYRYFSDMSSVFDTLLPAIRPGGCAAFVVGPNRTTLGGKAVLIDTPRLLASIAEARGWHIAELLPLDTYQRYDVHQRNSITKETLVLLRRP